MGGVRHRALAALACYVVFKLRAWWDDALDVWGVHGVGGSMGIVLPGIFASRVIDGVRGLAEGNPRQFWVQLFGVAVAAIYAFGVTYGLLKLIDRFVPVRVSPAVEAAGLDASLHGESAFDVAVLRPAPAAAAAQASPRPSAVRPPAPRATGPRPRTLAPK